MRKRILVFVLAVSTLFVLTPETAMAARMEGTSMPAREAMQKTPPEEPEAAEAEPKAKTPPVVLDMEGDGTKASPYRIENAGQLCAFADLVNGAGGEPATGICALLTCNISLSGVCGAEIGSWTPIGTIENPYTGTFDGGTYTITGLYCYEPNASYTGLFGCNAGTIKNLGVVGADITAGNYTGGVCGYNNGIISGCRHVAATKGANYAGGICGYNDAGGTVSVCYNTGGVSGGKYVGGICGYNKNNVVDCYNLGPINGDSTSIGGVCGYNKALLSNCFNTGTVNGGGRKYIGSVCGYNHSQSTFLNSYYLITGEEKGNYAVAMSTERFASGEVCWLLNGEKSENVVWYQTCGTGFPTFSGKTVYRVQRQKEGGRADEMIVAYTNEKEQKRAADNAPEQTQDSGASAATHVYQEPEWEWEDYKAAKAVFTCRDCGEKRTREAVITKSTKAATCAAQGETVYTAIVELDGKTYEDRKTIHSEKLPHQPLTWILAEPATCETAGISLNCWTCPACGKYFEDEQGTKEIAKRQVVLSALGHSYPYDQKLWSWKMDCNPVAASLEFICDHGCGKTETREAKVSSETSGSCMTAGEITYTAVVTFQGKKYQDQQKVSGKPIPHSYGEPIWKWKDDFSAEAVFTCKKCGDSQTVAAVIDKQTLDPTCLKEGEHTYTASVTFEGRDYTCADRKTEKIPKTVHSYTKQPQWTWAADYKSAAAVFTCDICATETAPVAADVTETQIPGADCGTPGKMTYAASVVFQGKTYNCPEVKEKPMSAAHTLTHIEAKAAACEGEGNEEYWQCGVCHKLFADAAGAKELTAVPVLPATGHTLNHVKDNLYQCIVCGSMCEVNTKPDGTTSIISVEEGAVPQSDSVENGEEAADQSADIPEGEDVQNGRDDIADTAEDAARHGILYPENEAEPEDGMTGDTMEENIVDLRAESSKKVAGQKDLARQGDSLQASVALLCALAGVVMILLYKGKREVNR